MTGDLPFSPKKEMEGDLTVIDGGGLPSNDLRHRIAQEPRREESQRKNPDNRSRSNKRTHCLLVEPRLYFPFFSALHQMELPLLCLAAWN